MYDEQDNVNHHTEMEIIDHYMQIYTDKISKILYATDASAYREIPYGVCFPQGVADIQNVIREASEKGLSLIPRCAGTSLAGQVVGSGIVADVSRHMNRILEINPQQGWARVEPGVVLDELNLEAAQYDLFFGPETSTSNRCCLGGMVGNNSCGSHSLVYGSTRDHLLEAKVVLSDGSLAEFSSERGREMLERVRGRIIRHVKKAEAVVDGCVEVDGIDQERIVGTDGANLPERVTLEERIYRQLWELAADETLCRRIEEEFPDKEVKRRNCGYALDLMLEGVRNWRDENVAKGESQMPRRLAEKSAEAPLEPNLCQILAGSEGTLAFAYELKVRLVPLPPKQKMVLCAHCNTLPQVFRANLVALKHGPVAVELMDSNILELSKKNLQQQKNRFFVQGDPAAILIVELAEHTLQELEAKTEVLEQALLESGLVYVCSRVYGKDISRVWELRKAGLGLLSGMKGDGKPVSVIEDTAVAPYRLPAYMDDFAVMLREMGLSCVYHAHIGTGELHLRPILNIKKAEDRVLFREVATRTAVLVKRHRGSLSGEHGDGRLRGEFIPMMYGEEIYQVLRQVKQVWDEHGVFNVGKIVDTPPMDSCLRYDSEQRYAAAGVKPYFNYSQVSGLFCAVEQCNGSGDCRKSIKFGGVLCPSFRVKGYESFSTRARANVLREVLTRGGETGSIGSDSLPRNERGSFVGDKEEYKVSNPFCSKEAYEILDSCLSCKACKKECPSNVDMTRFKAEFLQQQYHVQGRGLGRGSLPFWGGVPLRAFLVSHMADVQRLGSWMPRLYNRVIGWDITTGILKRVLRFAFERQLPTLSQRTLRRLVTGIKQECSSRKVYLFADEFTNYMEAELGLTFVKLMNGLGYVVEIPRHVESGRAAFSKGMLRHARVLARKNVLALRDVVTGQVPLVGIEPSCILSFRDEYPAIVGEDLAEDAAKLAENCLLYDEFLMQEVHAGRITAEQFTSATAEIWLHGHCHQKALVGVELTTELLRLPVNYKVNVIPSGCCGMAGSFGYEREHFATSLEIGEQVLFPAVRAMQEQREQQKASQQCSQFINIQYLIAAPGTSCRQQILDGTGVKALHPIEVLWESMGRSDR